MCICYTPPYPFYQGTATGDQLVSPERAKISRQAVRPAQLRGKLGCPSACPAERCLPRGKRADPSLLGLSQAKHHLLSLQSFHNGFHSPSLHPPPPRPPTGSFQKLETLSSSVGYFRKHPLLSVVVCVFYLSSITRPLNFPDLLKFSMEKRYFTVAPSIFSRSSMEKHLNSVSHALSNRLLPRCARHLVTR